MTSFQSTLADGDDDGIAEELAASQREISIAEFFEKNKHMLGFDSGARGLVTAVKEAVDNALDATEEAGILPDIYVEIQESGDYYTLVVEDNGPGITKEQIPKIFGKLLYGSRFHSREQSLTPDQELLVRRDGVVDTVPIGVLCDAYLPIDGAATAPLSADIEVPSFDRESHEMSWQPVTHAIRHETDEQTYEITTEKGRTVEVTGNHSLFSVTANGETKQVKAGDLEPGDAVLTPRSLPTNDDPVESVNLLEHITPDQLEDRRLYVYGFDRETLEEIRSGETIRKKPNADSTRKRYYYRYEGVDVLKDSLESNYLEGGYLPASTVLELGWEERAADCELKTYQVGGDETTIPVTMPLTAEFARLLGYYVAEGHVGPRQVGFTFGSHEGELIEATETAVAGVGGGTTTVERERNSTRVKAFGSPLAMFLGNVCGKGAENKRVPSFLFDASEDIQQEFLTAVYQGDGSDSHPGNELSHTTVSKTLARGVSVLWNMQGVLASTETAENTSGYAEDDSTTYRTKVYGADLNVLDAFGERKPTGEQGYKRVPTSLLDDVRVDDVDAHTVPDTVPGLLRGAGVGSNLEHAEAYQSLIEAALDGGIVEKPRYTHNLVEMGLLDESHEPTAALEELHATIRNLHGITDTDMCLLPVKSVEETDAPEYVYDISVPGASGEDENFVVANDGALSVKNSRGQQGIGISAAVLYSQLTSGTPAKITSRTQGAAEANYYELVIDTDTNEPVISEEETVSWDRPHGTRIELEMEANMRARGQLHDYAEHTAVVNPHARLELREPEGRFKFERAEDAGLPAETEEIRPHPHGVELGALIKMLGETDSRTVRGFLREEFTRVGAKTADSICDAFRDRRYGRELAWTIDVDEGNVDARIVDAVSNKPAADTEAFAAAVADALAERGALSHTDLETLVADVAADVEADSSFGATVRGHVVDALWDALTAHRRGDLYRHVDAATTVQKDGATVEALAERLAAKFGDETPYDRVTRDELRDFVERAADQTETGTGATVGETARENVTDELWTAAHTVTDDLPAAAEIASDRNLARDLLDAMRTVDVMAPPTSCLAPIQAESVEAGLRKEFDADFYAAATRDAEVHGGDPFVVEAGIAYGGDLAAEGTVDVMRFANRVPLVYQRGACATTKVLKDIGWRNYGLDQPGGSGLPSGPCVIMVHVASTNVPFTSESKDAVASVPEIEDEVELAVREAARDLKGFLNERRSRQKRQEKQSVIMDVLPTMAEKVSEMTGREPVGVEDSLARIMNNVLVERERADDTVRLTVENNTDANADIDLTDIVSAEPSDVSDGTVVEMDGEWFVKWSPTVPSGEDATLEYAVAADADCDLSVNGVGDEKLTISQ
ncbi:DNA topoisomerase-6 subunit B [Halarchaeum solikamskense]|nr:ATP-binding protein [Halarchaeum solikamskense]MBP2252173.1 DNA topoisomerase-6 subunit B [Halarchaeum solikamskense]